MVKQFNKELFFIHEEKLTKKVEDKSKAENGIVDILKINEIIISVTNYEHFKRQEHGESLDKCKKNSMTLAQYNSSSNAPEEKQH